MADYIDDYMEFKGYSPGDPIPRRNKRNRGFDCEYFRKDEIDFVSLVKKARFVDLGLIHKSMGITSMTVSQYLNKKKSMSHITIPELFIEKVNEAYEIRMSKLDRVNKIIKDK